MKISDAVGFGIRRKKSGNSIHQAVLTNINFEKNHPVNFCFGWRGVYTALKFTFHGGAKLEPSPRCNISLSLQRAARYRLHQLKCASLVRQSGALSSKCSTTDFARLILAPHLIGGYCRAPNNNLHCTANPDTLNSLFCLSRESSNLPGTLAATPLQQLRNWWQIAQGENLEQKFQRAGELRRALDSIQSHCVPKVALEILRFIFHFTLTFEEVS